MISKRKRYLFIGIFFLAITILSAVPILKGNAETKHFTYTIICGLAAVLFLKNALIEK